MRALLSCRPFLGHLFPMVPLARALEAAGHEVVMASTERFIDDVRRVGITGFAAGTDPCVPSPPGERAAPEGGYGVSAIRSKVVDIVAWAGRERVDIVIREPTDFSGVLAAEALGLPHVTLGRSQILNRHFWGSHLGWVLDDVRKELGLAPDPDLATIFGSGYLDTVPAWFQPPDQALPLNRVGICPEVYDGGQDAASQRLEPEMIDVYLTFGTVYNRNHELFRSVVGGVAAPGRRVLCTVGADQDPEAVLPTVPPDVVVRRYVPQSSILERCRVVVCHGGYSTVMGALGAGVPLVVLPRGSDHDANARQCVRLGAGIRIGPDELSPAVVHEAVEQLLTDPAYSQRARQLRDALAREPASRFAVRLLERVPALHELGVDVVGRPFTKASDQRR